ncbi:MAG: 4-hydroxy-tetrahydrodipicolinate reductase [Chlamydiales bacterium]
MHLKNSSMPIRLVIIGALGRMGQMVIKGAMRDPSISLRAIVTRELHKDSPDAIQTSQIHSIIGDVDLIIDFSSPNTIYEYIPIVTACPTAVVIGTTDLQSNHYALLEEAAHTCPIMHAANFSFGIFLLRQWLQTVINYSPKCQITITETHHKGKRDRPSGTAKILHSQLQSIQQSIPIRSFRRKSTVGTHKINIHLEDEDITISHCAKNRTIFADGSIQAGKWLTKQPPGKYTIEDYFSCKKNSFILA